MMAGCFPSDSLRKACDEHNLLTYLILTDRLGKGWEDKYEASIDSALAIDTSIPTQSLPKQSKPEQGYSAAPASTTSQAHQPEIH